jgi:sterol 3beta-glucosyltransferase
MILGPTLPTSEFPIWPLEKLIIFNCLNKWSYNVLFSMLWSSEKDLVNKWRKDVLRLKEIKCNRGMSDIIDALKAPVIISYSRYLCPNQRVPSDYPVYAHLHGFIVVPDVDESQIDSKLIQFMDLSKSNNRNVIYLGFGSMPAPDIDELINLCIDICVLCDCNGVLVAGWSELFDSDGNIANIRLNQAVKDGTILAVKSVSHNWLFPRVNCIIHHGGVSSYIVHAYML